MVRIREQSLQTKKKKKIKKLFNANGDPIAFDQNMGKLYQSINDQPRNGHGVLGIAKIAEKSKAEAPKRIFKTNG